MATGGKTSNNGKAAKVWAALRIALGLIMLWAFMDKMFGLGYSTCRTIDAKTKVETVKVLCVKSVSKGASPTVGFLKNSPKGPFKAQYNEIAGNKVADFLFMSGLLLIGLALISGIGVKIAAVSGILMMLMMWTAVLPPANHPVLDDHVIYAIVLLGILVTNNEQVWGLGKWWQKQNIVKKYPILA